LPIFVAPQNSKTEKREGERGERENVSGREGKDERKR
jgi:hypothetical protein